MISLERESGGSWKMFKVYQPLAEVPTWIVPKSSFRFIFVGGIDSLIYPR